MGVKRPFDEEFQDSPAKQAKQAKQFDSDTVWNSVPDDFLSDRVQNTATDQDEAADSSDKYLPLKDFGTEGFHYTSSLANKEPETSLPMSWVTSSSSEEDAGSGEQFPSSFFDDYFPFNYPRGSLPEPEDAYTSLMNCPPRKPIPVGPEFQAEIPPWNPNIINDENEVGTRIIIEPLPEASAYGDVKIGQGRRKCDCIDVGSVRCMGQHIKEARDKLREFVGDERFSELGFYDMGEEVVARKWTEEEEGIFHEVIYSNPASRGKNFWRQLPLAFPSRTMKEIVSYYFNVFMLRRRTVQNRSSSLEIDSDDDEWHGNDGTFFGRAGQDKEFAYGDRFDNGIAYDDEYDSAADDDDSDDDGSNGDGADEVGLGVDGGDSGEGANSKDDLKSQNYQSNNGIYSDYLAKTVSPSGIREDHNVLEDSSNSCESQLYSGGSCISYGLGHDTFGSTVNDGFTVTGSLAGESNDSSDGFDSGFFLEPSAAKAWEESCSTGYARRVDLLSTCNMIEEIFGPCSSKMN